MFHKRNILFFLSFTLTVVTVLAFPDSPDDKASLTVNVEDANGHHLHLMEGDIAVPDGSSEGVTSLSEENKAVEKKAKVDTAEIDLRDVSWKESRDNLSSSQGVKGKGGKSRKNVQKSQKYAISDDFRIWPNGVIPYSIDPSLWSSKSAIIKAMRHIESRTCIRFVPARNNERDYLRIYRGGERSCFSMIGRSGGGQAVSLGNRCLIRGVILHELVHSIGFYHQQTRSDRDKYLKIIWSNIDPAFIDQFRRKMPQQNRILRPFDYDSIMLYGPKLFSRNGQDTMIPIRRGIRLLDTGVKNGLSDEDATSINLLYGCHDTQVTDESENSRETDTRKGSAEIDENARDAKVNETDKIGGGSGGNKSKAKDRKDIFKKTLKPKSFHTPSASPVTPSSTRVVSKVKTTLSVTPSTTQARRVWSRSPWKDGKSRRTIKTATTTVRGTMTTTTVRQLEESEKRTTSSPWRVTLAARERRKHMT